MQPQVSAGWRTILKINNQVVAAGFVLDYSIDSSVDVISGLDNVFPSELAPEKIAVTMTIRVYRNPDNDPVESQIAPGGDRNNKPSPAPSTTGEFAEMQAFVSSPYISVEVRDRLTDRTLFFMPKAFLIKRSGSVEAENLMTETWTIMSIGYGGTGSQTSGLLGAIGSFFSS